MRLRDVHQLIRGNAPKLTLSARHLGGNQAELLGRRSTREALAALVDVPHLGAYARSILEHDFFRADSTLMDLAHGTELSSAVSQLRRRAEDLVLFLDGTLPPEFTHYLAIKLPLKDSTTDEATKMIGSVHLAIDQPLRRMGHSPLTVRADVGSWWLEIDTGSLDALKVIGTLLCMSILKSRAMAEAAKARSASLQAEQEVAKLYQERSIADQEDSKAERERLRTESARVANALKTAEARLSIADLECRTAASEMAAKSNEPIETESTIVRGIDELAYLFGAGAEFSLQYDAPPEIRSSFPREVLNAAPEPPSRLLSTGRD